MKELLQPAWVVDLALVVIGLEVAVLLALRQRLAPRLRPPELLGQVLAGGFLLLALRSVLRGEDSRWTLAFMTASFPAHVFDVVRRARRSAVGETAGSDPR